METYSDLVADAVPASGSLPPRPSLEDPLWYKDALIYQVHVKAFYDSNGDGIGDFRGLTAKLDYIRDLGVNTLWLLPFYPSPQKDDGYDIADYHGVHPDYGTLADFRHFIREAHRRELKVITELVINHTSDQHPWFQAARRAPPNSSKRNYYVWSESDKKWPETRIIFTDTEKSNWTWDPIAGAYYWHRFFSHQPDLNFDNPNVIRAVLRVMRYWLDMGVDGMRLDAIPYLCERDGTNNENLPETHDVLKYIRGELDARYHNRFLLAEVNQWPEDVREYFGNGDECHMAYHFPLMPRIYMAVAEEDRHPIVDIMAQTPDIPERCQWAIFLRNHDELTLEMVTERERDYMYRTYAADKRMRVNVGIRRRLAPLMENNRRKIELVNSLLLSIIGSPVLYYGDEIGMGDNFYLGDRHGVRTPMQWSPDRNAGFSRADPQSLYLPPIMDAVYGYPSVNVEAQSRSASSPLQWMRRLISVRSAHPAFGRGSLRFIRPGNRKILAYVREYHDEIILCVANLSRSSQPVELDLKAYKGRVPVEMLGRTPFPPIGELTYLLTLPAWGFYWFVLATDAKMPEWHDERPVRAELPVLVIPEGLRALLASRPGEPSDIRGLMATRVRGTLERQILPDFLARQRWFAGKGRAIASARMPAQDEWRTGAGDWLLGFAHVEFQDGEAQDYALPLALAWEDIDAERIPTLRYCTLAQVRQHARVGVVYDAFWDNAFCRSIVEAMGADTVLPLKNGRLVFSHTGAFGEAADVEVRTARHPAFEQTNSMVILDEKLVLKCYRRLRQGINPEIEVGRFLTDASPFPHIAPVLGELRYCDPVGRPTALAVLQRFVHNQGSGWNYVVEYLQRFLDQQLTVASGEEAFDAADVHEQATPHAAFLPLVAKIGQRTGELHVALAATTGDPAFDPEPVSTGDVASWIAAVEADVELTFVELARRASALAVPVRAAAERLLAARSALTARIAALAPRTTGFTRTRFHGDFHLGQLLIVEHDFVIVDFEGEPFRPLEERRRKHSPLRDVAGMLRSFSYAAAVALDEATGDRPADRVRAAEFLARWERETCAAFVDAYAGVARNASSYPVTPEDVARLIELFVLEKALYEIRYELGARPDWVRIPIAGLLERLGPRAAAAS
ncbi:MAG TPA: maltose alpha-D-glucosyltransferase [Casimicrobiaceae bacterium]|nr:maltose alpha-D-glucosyltransferase [Casimicrobiaceae bacterium]